MALGRDKKAQLSMAIGMTIGHFTKHTPATILEIVEAMMFTAGHAMAQKEARQSVKMDQRALREYAIAALDKGIAEGSVDRTKPQLFIPPPKQEIN